MRAGRLDAVHRPILPQTMKTHIALPFLLLCLATPSCIAQATAQAPQQDPLVLPAGEHKLPVLVDQCAAYLKVNILASPQELAGGPQVPAFTLQHPVSLDAAGCEDFLGSMLWQQGFALTWLDQAARTMEVIGMNGPRAREVSTRAVLTSVEAVLARPNSRLPVSVVVPLAHVNATVANNSLRPFFASAGRAGAGELMIGTMGNGATLLLTGSQNQVAHALRIVQACDVPAAQPDPNDAAQVMARMQQLEQRIAALEQQLRAAAAPKAK